MPVSLAMLALGPNARISIPTLKEDLQTTWPSLPPVSDPQVQDTNLSMTIGDADVIIAHMPVPIPWSDLEGACQLSWLWKDAEATMRGHTTHAIVTVLSDASPVERAKLLTQVTAALLRASVDPVGVYWGTAALVIAPSMFRKMAVEVLPTDNPLPIWINFAVGPNDDGTFSGFTKGLAAFDLMEFETGNAAESPGELRERLMNLSEYIMENGPVIKDGDTVGTSEAEKITVVYGPSAFGNSGRVMRLNFEAAKPAKKSMFSFSFGKKK